MLKTKEVNPTHSVVLQRPHLKSNSLQYLGTIFSPLLGTCRFTFKNSTVFFSSTRQVQFKHRQIASSYKVTNFFFLLDGTGDLFLFGHVSDIPCPNAFYKDDIFFLLSSNS
jgi:hypothetical protein